MRFYARNSGISKLSILRISWLGLVLSRNLEGVVGFTAPARASSTTTSSGAAVGTAYGNSAVVSGSVASQTNMTYAPPQTLQVGSYSGRGYVIRFKPRR
jgi:hypothetical protein